MKPKKIIAVCSANAFRSPAIDVSIQGRLRDMKVEDIVGFGRGVNADYFTDVVAGKKPVPEKYIVAAVGRAIGSPDNYSENIRNMLEQHKPEEKIARYVLGEERQMYKLIIQRYCEEKGMPGPSGFHQQLHDSDIDELSHMIVASESELVKPLADLSSDNVTVLGIEDNLGGTYKDKLPVLDKIKEQVYDTLPKILE